MEEMKKFENRDYHKETHTVLENSSLLGKTPDGIRKEIEGKIGVKIKRVSGEIIGPFYYFPKKGEIIDDGTPFRKGERIEIVGLTHSVQEFNNKYLY